MQYIKDTMKMNYDEFMGSEIERIECKNKKCCEFMENSILRTMQKGAEFSHMDLGKKDIYFNSTGTNISKFRIFDNFI